MDYQVWTKEEFGDNYTKVDCGDLAAARKEIDKAVRTGGEPILTVEVPYKLDIKVSEVGAEVPKKAKSKQEPETKVEEVAESEVNQSATEPDQDTGAEGKGKV